MAEAYRPHIAVPEKQHSTITIIKTTQIFNSFNELATNATVGGQSQTQIENRSPAELELNEALYWTERAEERLQARAPGQKEHIAEALDKISQSLRRSIRLVGEQKIIMQVFNSFQELLAENNNDYTSAFNQPYNLQEIQRDLAAAGILENVNMTPTAAQIALWLALSAGIGANEVARPNPAPPNLAAATATIDGLSPKDPESPELIHDKTIETASNSSFSTF